MLDRLYEEIGEKIKNWAKWIFIIEAIASVVGGIALIIEDLALIGVLVMVLGPVAAWVLSWLLYAFGELVETVCSIFIELSDLASTIKNKTAGDNPEPITVTNPTAGTRTSVSVAAGQWQCSCGRVNDSYVSSCVCGLTKQKAANKIAEKGE